LHVAATQLHVGLPLLTHAVAQLIEIRGRRQAALPRLQQLPAIAQEAQLQLFLLAEELLLLAGAELIHLLAHPSSG
jgi:hypothetical protein